MGGVGLGLGGKTGGGGARTGWRRGGGGVGGKLRFLQRKVKNHRRHGGDVM